MVCFISLQLKRAANVPRLPCLLLECMQARQTLQHAQAAAAVYIKGAEHAAAGCAHLGATSDHHAHHHGDEGQINGARFTRVPNHVAQHRGEGGRRGADCLMSGRRSGEERVSGAQRYEGCQNTAHPSTRHPITLCCAVAWGCAARTWLNDTGMKRSDTLPSTTVRQKMSASRLIL